MDTKNLVFISELPYPSTEIKKKHSVYGKLMLDNVGGSISEMSAVSLYFYNNLIVNSNEDISYIFHKISIVEMHHLSIFATLAHQLGENPRLWTYKNRNLFYWSPGYNKYSTQLCPLLTNALNGERSTVQKYKNQMNHIDDPIIKANLERIIMDEMIHIDIFQKLHQEYCQ